VCGVCVVGVCECVCVCVSVRLADKYYQMQLAWCPSIKLWGCDIKARQMSAFQKSAFQFLCHWRAISSKVSVSKIIGVQVRE